MKSDQTYVDASLNLKSDQTYVDASLNLKADKTDVKASLNLKSDLTYVDASLNLKLPVSNPTVNGLLTVNNGDVSLNQNLNVGGNTTLNGDLSIHGNLSVFQTENNTVINTTVNNYDLIVSEDLSLNGELSVKDNASFNKNVTIAGYLNAQYPNDSIPMAAIDNIETKANKTYVDSALSLKSDQTYVDNSLNLKLPISNPSVQGNLVVSNNATISGNTIINGNTSTIGLSASGTTTLTNANINSSLNINSDINIDGMNFDIFKRKSTRGFNIVNATDITHSSDYWNSNNTFSHIIISGDGKTIAYKPNMLSGSPTSDRYFKVFKLDSNNNWNFTTNITTTLSNAKLNFDGSRLIVSDKAALYTPSNYTNAGVIYVFDTNNGNTVITIWGNSSGSKYGIKNAISGDGQRFIYTSEGLYDIHTSGGTYSDPDNTYSYYYQFIDINYDGSIVAGVGANNGNFFVRLLSVGSNTVTPIGSAIYNSNFNYNINGIYLSQDGYTVAVDAGNTYIYTYSNNSWIQKGSVIPHYGKVVFDKDDNDYIRIVSTSKVHFYHYYYNEWAEESSLDVEYPGDCDEYGLLIASSYYNSTTSQGYVKITQRDINTHLHQGYINVKDLEVTNSLKSSGDISFNNRVDICGNLYAQYPDNSIPTSAIDGSIGLDSETDISLNANLNIGGNTKLDSTLYVEKGVDFSSTLTVDGDVSLNSNLSLGGNLTLGGDLTMDGTLSVRQTQSVMNTVVNNYEVIITNDLSLNGDMSISGDASFQNNVDICGNLYAQYPNESIPPSAIIGGITVDRNVDLNLNAGLNVIGGSSFSYVNVDNSMNVKDLFVNGSMFYKDIVLPINKKYELFDTFSPVSVDEITHPNNMVSGFSTNRTVFSGDGNVVAYQSGLKSGWTSVDQYIHVFKKGTDNVWSLASQMSTNNIWYTNMDINYDGSRIIASYPFENNRKGVIHTFNSETGQIISTRNGPDFNREYGYNIAISGDGSTIIFTESNESVIYSGNGLNTSYRDSINPSRYSSIDINYDGTVFAGVTYNISHTAIIKNNNGSLVQLGSHITKTGNMKLSDDGYTIAISNSGNIYIYEYVNNNWSEKSIINQSGVIFFNKDTTDSLQIYQKPNMYLYQYQNNIWALTNTVDLGSNNVGLSDQSGLYFASDHYTSNGQIHSIKITARNERTFIQHEYSDTKDLRVRGKTIIDGSLNVIDDASFNGRVDICGNFYAQYPDSSIPPSAIDGVVGLDNNADISLNANMVIDGTTNLNSSLSVDGPTVLSSSLNVSNSTSLSSTLSVSKATTLNSTLLVRNDATFDTNANVKGNLIVDGDLSVRQTNSIMNTVVNNYEVIITNDLSLNGNAVVSGDASFNGRVDIYGNLYAQYPDNSIPTTAIDGDVGLDTNSDLTLNAGLSVGNNATFNGRVDVCGNFYAQYPTNSIPPSAIVGGVVTEASVFNPSTTDLSLNNNLYVNGDASFNSDVSIKGAMTSTNDVSLNGNLITLIIPGTEHHRLTSDLSNIALTSYNIPKATSTGVGVRFVDRINYSRFSYASDNAIYYIKKNTDGTWQKEDNASTRTTNLNNTKYIFSRDGQYFIAWFQNASNNNKWDICLFHATNHTDTNRASDILVRLSSDDWDDQSERVDMAISATSTYDNKPIVAIATNKNKVHIGLLDTNSSPPNLSIVEYITPPSVSSVNFNYPEQTPDFDITHPNSYGFGIQSSIQDRRIAISKNGRIIFISVQNIGVYIYKDGVYTTTIRGYSTNYNENIQTSQILVNDHGTILAINSLYTEYWTVHRYNETDDVWYQLGDPISGEIQSMNGFGNSIIRRTEYRTRWELRIYISLRTFNFETNVWEYINGFNYASSPDLNGIGNMVVYRGPSQIPADNNNKEVGILEAPTYTTEYFYDYNFTPSKLFVSGDVSVNYNLYVGSDASFGNNVDICGNLTIGKNVIIDGELQVRKSESIMNTVINNYEVIVTNDLSLNGNLVVSGNSTFNNNLDICGNLYAQYPDNSIPTTAIDGIVGVDTESDLSLNANLYVGSDVSFNSKLFVDGDVSFNSNTHIGNKLSVSGDTSFNNRVDICGNLYAQYPDNSIPSTAIVGGATGVNPFEDATFYKNVDVCGNFYAQYPDSSIPPSAIIGGVLGEGSSFNPNTDDLSLNNNLYVNGDVSLNSNLYIESNADFNSDVLVKGVITTTNDVSLNGIIPVTVPDTEHYRLTSDLSNIALTSYNIPQASGVAYSVRFVDRTNYNRFSYLSNHTINYVKRNTDGTWQREDNASTETINYSQTKYVFSHDGQYLIAWFQNTSNNNKWDICIFDATNHTKFSRSGDILDRLSSDDWDDQSEYVDMAISATSTYDNKPIVAIATNKNKVHIGLLDTNSSPPNLSIVEYITPPSVSSVNFNYPEQTPGFDITHPNSYGFGIQNSINERRIAISKNGRIICISVQNIGVYIYKDRVYTTTIRGYSTNYSGNIQSRQILVNDHGTILAIAGADGYWTVHRYNETDDVWYQLGDPISGEIQSMSGFGNIIIVKLPERSYMTYTNEGRVYVTIRDYKLHTFNFETNVWEVTKNFRDTISPDINGIGNMIVYRGPSQIAADTNNSFVGILEAPTYTTEYIYSVNFKPSNLFVNGDVSINYNLNVGSDASFSNDVDICGNLTIGKNVVIDGELQVRKTESIMNTVINNYEVIVTNDLSLNGDLTVSGNLYSQYPDNSIPATAIDGTLSIDTESDISLNANLSVDGNASFNTRVDICGNLYAQYPDNSIPVSALNGNVGVDTESDLSLNAKLSVGQDASFNSNVSVLGDLTIDGTLQVRETESVMNTVVNNYEVIITNDLSLNGDLVVSGDASFNNNVIISNNLSIDGDASFNNNVIISNNLSINGDASFNNNVDISGNLIVSKNLSLEGYSVPDTDNIVGMTLTSRYTTMGFPNVYSSSSYRSPVALGHFDQTNSSYVDDYPSIIYYYEASNEYNMKLLGKYRSGTNWANTTEITGFVNTSTAYKNFILSYDSRFFLRQTNSNVIEIYKRPSNTKNQNNSFHTQLIGSINNADGTMSISDNNVLVTRDSTTQLLRVYSIDENSITQTHTINNVSSLTYHNGSSQTRTRTGYWSGFISGDGKTIVANMSYYGLSIFRLVNNDWVYDVTIKENQNNIVIANYAINAKGNYIIYTTYEKNVYVYYYNDQSWSQIGSTLTNGDTDYIAAINRFGTVIAIGGLWNYSPTGMKIYQLINGDWQFFANVKNAYSYINQSIFCGINSNSILSIGVNNNYDYREGFNLWVYNYDLDYGTKHIESKFSISGDASFNGRVDICGNLYAQYPDNSIPVSAIDGTVGVDTDSDLSLNAKLSIGNDASFNANVSVLGDSSFNGRVDICGNFYAQYPDNSIPASAIIGGVSSGGNQSVSNLAFGDGNKIIGVTDDVTFDDDDFALIKDSGAINPNLDVSANLYVSGDVSFNNGSVLIPTPLTTDISNSAINIGYLEGMGYITASGLLRQFEP